MGGRGSLSGLRQPIHPCLSTLKVDASSTYFHESVHATWSVDLLQHAIPDLPGLFRLCPSIHCRTRLRATKTLTDVSAKLLLRNVAASWMAPDAAPRTYTIN